MFNSVLKQMMAGCLAAVLLGPPMVDAANKFEKEVEKETAAVKLLREAQRGGYDVVTTSELKKWIDSGRIMVVVDTMLFYASYKKGHVPGAVQFLFPIAEMNEWVWPRD